MKEVIDKWTKLQNRAQVEITTSPFYHPILPLLPPEDQEAQISRAVTFYKELFSREPLGMWPSEGSVSPDIVPPMTKFGIKWIATDEEILEESLGVRFTRNTDGSINRPDLLYKPYNVENQNFAMKIVFRDKYLSNLIGFHYRYAENYKLAAEDFISKIKKTAGQERDPLICIILDGENAWEYYRNNGVEFLSSLYKMLEKDDKIETVILSEYLEKNKTSLLKNLYSGSWINHNFDIWNGDEEDKKAWEFLFKARGVLIQPNSNVEEDRRKLAFESLYAAEGSDWFWWFGDDFSSSQDREYDYLFRKHLMNVYSFLKKRIPDELLKPIKISKKKLPYTEPCALLRVKIDGRRSNYFEWLAAGHYDLQKDFSTMTTSDSNFISDIYFGFSEENFLLRLDFNHDVKQSIDKFKNSKFKIIFLSPKKLVVDLASCKDIAIDKILELSYPINLLGFSEGEEVEFYIDIEEDGIVSRLPATTSLKLRMSKLFDKLNWSI